MSHDAEVARLRDRLDEDAVLTFPLEAGALLRKRARATIEGQALLGGLSVECQEARGFFESTFYFRVTGQSAALLRFSRWLSEWGKANES